MSKTSKQTGWSGAELDAILDRRPVPSAGTKPAPVGYDPAELARLLG